MPTPKVSVVMAVYNGAAYLRPAIESILSQTWIDFEFLVVDDASTDETRSILSSYEDPRLVVLENEQNQGLAAALNRALAVARGDYIARQDADDLSHPERMAKQVAFLDSHPEIGVVAATSEWIDSEDRHLRVWEQPTHNAEIQQTLLWYCCLIHGSVMCRRKAALDVGAYDSQMRTGQDYDLWLKISEGWDLAVLPDTLYRYRWHNLMASQERQTEQTNNANMSRARALERRLACGWRCVGLARDFAFAHHHRVDRRWLAQRYVWWSAGARHTSRNIAFQFLLIALLLDPGAPEIWSYLAGILARKTGLDRFQTK